MKSSPLFPTAPPNAKTEYHQQFQKHFLAVAAWSKASYWYLGQKGLVVLHLWLCYLRIIYYKTIDINLITLMPFKNYPKKGSYHFGRSKRLLKSTMSWTASFKDGIRKMNVQFPTKTQPPKQLNGTGPINTISSKGYLLPRKMTFSFHLWELN